MSDASAETLRTLRDLRDRQELQDLALRYARAADRRDYALFEQLFAPDARLSGHRGDTEVAEPLFSVEGLDGVVGAMRGLERYETTLHVVANQLVEIEGDRARGETYCVAHHVYRENGAPMDYTMGIRYQDRFVRRKSCWMFAERRLAIDWERRTPLASGEFG